MKALGDSVALKEVPHAGYLLYVPLPNKMRKKVDDIVTEQAPPLALLGGGDEFRTAINDLAKEVGVSLKVELGMLFLHARSLRDQQTWLCRGLTRIREAARARQGFGAPDQGLHFQTNRGRYLEPSTGQVPTNDQRSCRRAEVTREPPLGWQIFQRISQAC